MTAPIFAGATDPGLRHENNEDAFAIAADQGIALLADGMGGANAGEVAAELAVGTALAILGQTAGLRSHDRLETAVQAANASVRDKAASHPRYQGMGTTLVAVLVGRRRINVAHVGDSRLYRLRQGELQQLTRDHSLQQEYIDQGLYSPDEARARVARNLLTHALGMADTAPVAIAAHALASGDRYLLCSDGLHEMLDAPEIAALLGRRQPLPEICSALIELANARGGRDNITVIVIET